jgi:hypothetical protein
MPRDSLPKVDVTVSPPASEPKPTPPPLSAEVIVASAVETGKAAEQANQAAARAEAAASQVTPELVTLESRLRQEIAEVAEIVGRLEQAVEMEEEELEQENTPEPVPASVVAIDVPPEAKRNRQNTRTTEQNPGAPKPARRGTILGRILHG